MHSYSFATDFAVLHSCLPLYSASAVPHCATVLLILRGKCIETVQNMKWLSGRSPSHQRLFWSYFAPKKMLHAICDFRAQYVWVFILRNDTFLWDKKLPVAPPHLACSEPLDTCKCIINLNGLLSKPGHVIFEFFTYSMFYSHQWSQVALKAWMLENQVNCDSLSVINPSSAKIRRRD